jgi:hypothetical protein
MTDGLRSTLHALAAENIRVLVVAPMPEQRFRVPACLAWRSLEFCSVPRSLAEDHRNMALAAVQKATDGAIGAYMWDPLPALCGDKVCLAERDGVVTYCDGDHLTYAGSRWLGRSFAQSRAWMELSADTGTDKRRLNQSPAAMKE